MKGVSDDEVVELTKAKFDEFIGEGIVLIDFFAEWCMPCLMMEPITVELAEKFQGKIKFGKVNIDSERELAHKYEVRSIPNFVLFKDGEVADQFVGAMSQDDFEEKLKEHLE
jgi:thioredoxin 1